MFISRQGYRKLHADLFGQEQRYDRDIKGAIVSNGIVHERLVDLVKQSLPQE